MDDLPLQNAPLPALLRHARRTYGAAMRAALVRAGHADIPANGLYVIGWLEMGAEGVAVGRLAAELGITRQGAGQLVETLVARGYLARSQKEDDRRRLVVTLTERGRAAAAIQLEARMRVDEELAGLVDPAALESARRALAMLVEMGRQARAARKGDDDGRE